MEENFEKIDSETIQIFGKTNYSEPAKKNYPTNKTDDCHIDDIWSLDILGLNDYDPENNRGYSYV